MTASDLARPSPPIPFNESERLRAVIETCLLDTAADARFDDVTALAAMCLDAPISAVSLIDQHRQWFKSIRGVSGTETSRHDAFCSYTILTREPLIVLDATLDTRFQQNPMVTGAPGVRFYAGVPIRSPDGMPIGALCVADTKPRERISAVAISILEELAQTVERYVAMHRLEAFLDKGTGFQNRRRFEENAQCLAVTEGAATDLWWALSVETCSRSQARAWGTANVDAHIVETGLRVAELLAARGGTHRLSERHLGFLVRCSSARAALALAGAVERALESDGRESACLDDGADDGMGDGAVDHDGEFAANAADSAAPHRVTLRRIDLFDDPARLVRTLLTPEVTALRFNRFLSAPSGLAEGDADSTPGTGKDMRMDFGDGVRFPDWSAIYGKTGARSGKASVPDGATATATAAARPEARMACQPRYELDSRRCVGFDATFRGGWAGCQDAIDIVMTRFSTWRAQMDATGASDVRLHLDLAPEMLLMEDFQPWLEWRLIEHRILPMHVAIELPASALFDPLSALRLRVNRLMAAGIGMVVIGEESQRGGKSGNGTGLDLRDWLPYLSFGAIRFAPSVLDAVARSAVLMEVARRLASLAHAVGSRVLVSGLDTDARLQAASMLECDEATGTIFVESPMLGVANFSSPSPLPARRG